MSDQEQSDQHFARALREKLEASASALDELTVARLRAARKRAVAQAQSAPARIRWWLTAGGFGLAAAITLAWTLTVQIPGAPPADSEVWELAYVDDSDEEALDLYEDLEFYEWLEDTQTDTEAPVSAAGSGAWA